MKKKNSANNSINSDALPTSEKLQKTITECEEEIFRLMDLLKVKKPKNK